MSLLGINSKHLNIDQKDFHIVELMLHKLSCSHSLSLIGYFLMEPYPFFYLENKNKISMINALILLVISLFYILYLIV